MASTVGATSSTQPHPNEPECLVANESVTEPPYSVFSVPERRLFTVIIGIAMLFSPLSANIYFPALDILQKELRTTAQNINLTITAYLVFQALAPALFGDAADRLGRRPVFLLMFALYTAANVGLAVQNSFLALLLLRMLQSLGCSATVAVAYGVVADIATAAERGSMLGFAMIATNLGPALAPLVGGALIDSLGWRSVFWFLSACGAGVMFLVGLVFPETARHIVGNGSVLPSPWRRPLLSLLTGLRIPKAALERRASKTDRPASRKLRFPNPLRSFRILLDPEAATVVSMGAVFYAVYYCIQVSMSVILQELYGLEETVTGLCFLSIGGGVVSGGITNGKLMDWSFRRTAFDAGYPQDHSMIQDLGQFPIEKARLRAMLPYNLVCCGILVGYGWSVWGGVHLSVLLVLQFGLGFVTTCIVQTCNTLLVDIFPDNPSAAAASGNIIRCGVAAGAVAAMNPLVKSMDYGWFFTLLALLSVLLGLAGTWLVQHKGKEWRTERSNRQSLAARCPFKAAA